MGSVLSLSSLACCCTSAACSAGCALCPSQAHSTVTKVMYAIVLLLTVIVSCVMLAPGVQGWMTKLPFCEESSGAMSEILDLAASSPVNIKINCADAVGYLAVYRICFVVTLFFFLMATLVIGVKSSRDPRAGIQDGLWGIKFLVIILGCVGAFFIPHGGFGTTWMYFGMIGGFLFILVQLVLIIDFAHSWAENWQSKYHRTESQKWFWALLSSTIFFYALTLIAVVLCFTYYTGIMPGDCRLHEFFISFNMILCVILSIVSILPIVQEGQPNSGLLQSSFVSLYIVYLTWSAMSNTPDNLCKADLMSLVSGKNATATDATLFNNDLTTTPSMDTASIIGLVIWFAAVLYSSIRSSSNSQAARLTMTDTVNLPETEGGGSVDVPNTVTYNWSLFHVMFGLATLYVMMTLTNWYAPGKNVDLQSISANMSAVWVKIISAWACFSIYVWTLVAPVLLPDRDFTI